MPNRKSPNYLNTAYRYAFNGKESDDEAGYGDDGLQDYGMRMYLPALGRFISVDPIADKYPWYTPYQFAGNKPIWAIDLDGLEEGFATMMMMHDLDEFAAGTITAEQLQKRQNARSFGGAAGLAGVVIWYTGGKAVNYTYPFLVEAAWWASNPVNQQIIAGVGFAFAGFIDDNPSNQYPGPTDDAARGLKLLFKLKGGKIVKFSKEAKAVFANSSEKLWAENLLGEGRNVNLLAESKQQSVSTADFLVDGVKTELKTISGVKDVTSDGLSKAIAGKIKEAGKQGKQVIVDLSDQDGATVEIARRGVSRYFGATKDGSVTGVRIVGKDFDEWIPRK